MRKHDGRVVVQHAVELRPMTPPMPGDVGRDGVAGIAAVLADADVEVRGAQIHRRVPVDLLLPYEKEQQAEEQGAFRKG